MKQLINTLLSVTAISLSVLPAQAVNEQLTAEPNAQPSQSAQEQIKEATTSSFCTAWPGFCRW
ncbi:hypothetical protein IQ238_13830 [Pleurocapsales cyanobacterium LEGE 06147]|nr:hypothetical protein [Pleurocapsales cyanobacterium LEGE 06147]